jgi:hypothetical protein
LRTGCCGELVPKRVETIGGWREVHNEELHNFYFSANIIRMIKSRKMTWGGSVMHVVFWWESQKEGDH